MRLQANDRAHKNRSRAAVPSLLVGLIFDDRGNRFTPAHAVKDGERYRYYVSQAAIKNPGSSHRGPIRIPAGEIERLVCSRVQKFLRSPHEVLDALSMQRKDVAVTRGVLAAARKWSELLVNSETIETRRFIRSVISRIVVNTAVLDVLLDKQALRAALLGSPGPPRSITSGPCNGSFSLKIKARLSRCGGEVRLVLPASSGGGAQAHHSSSLTKAVARAHDWYERIIRGQLTGSRSIAQATGLDERYVSRILQCAFLAPDIVESILDGRQPAKLSFENLRARVPIDWAAQRQVFGFPAK